MGSLIQVHPPINSGKEFSEYVRLHLIERRGIDLLERLQDSFHRVSALVGVMEQLDHFGNQRPGRGPNFTGGFDQVARIGKVVMQEFGGVITLRP